MSQQDNPSPEIIMDASFDTPLDTVFDTALRQHFQKQAAPDDDGFSQRVMTALPAPASRHRTRWAERVVQAQWAAMSLAACLAVALLSIDGGRLDFAHGVAAYSLIGLLVFWSIPSRWSRA